MKGAQRRSQDDGGDRGARGNRLTGKPDAENLREQFWLFGHPLQGRVTDKVDDKADDGAPFRHRIDDAATEDLDPAAMQTDLGRNNPAAERGKVHAVVSDETCTLADEFCRQRRFARPRWAADEDPVRPGQDDSRVCGFAHFCVVAGKQTVKRAPAMLPSGLVRFSASIVPRCASTICRVIDNPRPEFWPNSSALSLRSV